MTIAKNIFLFSILCAFVVGLICAAPTTSPPEPAVSNETEANDSNALPDLFYGRFKHDYTENFAFYEWFLERRGFSLDDLIVVFEKNEDTRKFNFVCFNHTESDRVDNIEFGKPFFFPKEYPVTLFRKNDTIFSRDVELSIKDEFLVATFNVILPPYDEKPKFFYKRQISEDDEY